MLYLTGIIVSVYLLILLLAKPQKTTADKILTAWQFLATIHLVYLYLFVTDQYKAVPGLLGWELAFPFIHGPFLYLYTLYLTNQQKHKYRWIWHFLPFLVTYLIWIPVLIRSPEQKLYTYEHGVPGYKGVIVGQTIAIIASGVGYVIAALILLKRHRRNIAGQFSNTGKITLNWLRYLIGGIGVIWFFVTFYLTAQSLYISVSLFIFFLGFFGVRQEGIFNRRAAGQHPPPDGSPGPLNEAPPQQVTALLLKSTAPGKVKYEKSTLTEEDAVLIHEGLVHLMQETLLFKNAELTLGDVAEQLDTHPGNLSQVINSRIGKSFYDYINGLRVEEFKKMMAHPQNQNYTLLSLAFECGFNSKSSFNRNFKKFTGQSPSDHLKSRDTD
ncbi:helix-turn-helix domain-containing protein [Niabella drilacis]|uniref:Helix-turn-helix domain-containing protein n=1 Tax=Niabella drilacis (strain DSM 25811 / CCM 8410 / CCUG 62505 / LMG 26954 / E90) TaxID=1285928 RepID=A0A1G7BQV1_NIADE|nr:helix-turn-helix domain-containing protein [Niabella drilacis]SDE29498.1 Helix-turn-helix domain-containing protein [Niabella drilacis]